MYSNLIKNELLILAHSFGSKHFGNDYQHPLVTANSAVIFKEVYQNFHPKSWEQIKNSSDCFMRTRKIHSHFKGSTPEIFEMQSSNSSDALAMNIFCHPNIKRWKTVKNILNIQEFDKIDFGFTAKVLKINSGYLSPDATEVDALINNEVISECKLTEADFCSKEKNVVESYAMFQKVFHSEKLLQTSTHYRNYQLIRNILAAEQHQCRFILFCDMRRPDLANSFLRTVNCIKDDYLDLRLKCEIIYWQDLAQAVGKDLKDFLNEKYGIF